jgi:hypothetical protein
VVNLPGHRRWVFAAALTAACGARAHDVRPVPGSPPAPAVSPTSASDVAPPSFATVEALATRQVRLAPGMHELARGEVTTSVPLPPGTRDTCVRVAFATPRPVALALTTRTGAVLEQEGPVAEGALGARGPVCFHADAAPRLEAFGDGGPARYVIWGAP